jgi:hypothetical protein
MPLRMRMPRASIANDHVAWFSHIAPGCDAVGQYGNVFTVSPADTKSGPADSNVVVSENFDIRAISLAGDSALVIVRHKEVMRVFGSELNARKLGSNAEHRVRLDEVMRQIWVRIGSDWKLKHWDDLSGRIWVDGKPLESWAVDRLAAPSD